VRIASASARCRRGAPRVDPSIALGAEQRVKMISMSLDPGLLFLSLITSAPVECFTAAVADLESVCMMVLLLLAMTAAVQ
jgi:hypothetical protein